MGGQNEKVLDMSTPVISSRSEINTSEHVRIHENSGEVHFHDDKKRLKVAVPSADFWREWLHFRQIVSRKKEQLFFFDANRNTVAIIESVSGFRNGKFELDACVSIMEVQQSQVMQSLNDFAAGK